jgi:hypothetical protein
VFVCEWVIKNLCHVLLYKKEIAFPNIVTVWRENVLVAATVKIIEREQYDRRGRNLVSGDKSVFGKRSPFRLKFEYVIFVT